MKLFLGMLLGVLLTVGVVVGASTVLPHVQTCGYHRSCAQPAHFGRTLAPSHG